MRVLLTLCFSLALMGLVLPLRAHPGDHGEPSWALIHLRVANSFQRLVPDREPARDPIPIASLARELMGLESEYGAIEKPGLTQAAQLQAHYVREIRRVDGWRADETQPDSLRRMSKAYRDRVLVPRCEQLHQYLTNQTTSLETEAP